jgi:hypothetical protein
MNILSIPYITGGLSHFIPLYVLNNKLSKNNQIKNYFLVNKTIQKILKIKGIPFVQNNYALNNKLIENLESKKINDYILKIEKEAFDEIEPKVLIEDCSFLTPLIAEKKNIPRISIQRTGIFRSIDESYRNSNHTHSIQKGYYSEKSNFDPTSKSKERNGFNNLDNYFLEQYPKPKAKIIPGIPSIECLPNNIKDRESYFYSGPLIIKDKPSVILSNNMKDFLMSNKQKSIVFITTGTVDQTPVEKYIEYFVKRNYAVITTYNHKINEVYKEEVFYNKLFPLHYICKISNLVIHQCGSGMYHYPIMNRKPSLTIGTRCYDREDIAQRLQKLRISGHIPHPDDNSNHWNIFIEMVNKFEKNILVDYNMMDKLRLEIDVTMSNFKMEKVIQYALR